MFLERVVFGAGRGASPGEVQTGAANPGREDNGTILLNEVGELRRKLQARLLHMVLSSQYCTLESEPAVHTHARIVAAAIVTMENRV
jgi:DNA-binding NtrC family response regulator